MKPAFTREIDGDDAKPPAQVAAELIKGLNKGYTYITNDFNTELLRSLALGKCMMHATTQKHQHAC
jgi:hypothetical protein